MGMYAAFHFVQLTVMNSGDERQLIRIVKVTLADGVVAPRQILRAERQPLASQPPATTVHRFGSVKAGRSHRSSHEAISEQVRHVGIVNICNDNIGG